MKVMRSILLLQFLLALKKVKMIKGEETMLNSSSVQHDSFSIRKFPLKKKLYLFIFVCTGSSLLLGIFSACSEWGLLSSCGARASYCMASLLWSTGSSACGLQQLWHVGSRAQAQQLWCVGLVAPNHVGSSRSGIEPLSPALAGKYVKKSLHGTELCNNKKKRERISPPGRLAGVSVAQGHDMRPGCCWVHFLLQLCSLFQVLTLWGCGHQRGWAQSLDSSQEAWLAVGFLPLSYQGSPNIRKFLKELCNTCKTPSLCN